MTWKPGQWPLAEKEEEDSSLSWLAEARVLGGVDPTYNIPLHYPKPPTIKPKFS